MAIDSVDFGGGRAVLMMGTLMPSFQRACNVSGGPKGDGLICIIRLPREGLARVQESRLLDLIAPEAKLMI